VLPDGGAAGDRAAGPPGAGARRSDHHQRRFGGDGGGALAQAGEDFRAYGVGNRHRHLGEMRDQTAWLANGGGAPELVFTPHLLPVRRGILESIYIPISEELAPADAIGLWLEDYRDEPFVDVFTDRTPGLVDVVGTNHVAIGVAPLAHLSEPLLLVVAAEDNLVKGASGQAIQNMNVMLGWGETEGLA
jgi:N-acetyl-gamma-glutamyl-phosphate reductase